MYGSPQTKRRKVESGPSGQKFDDMPYEILSLIHAYDEKSLNFPATTRATRKGSEFRPMKYTVTADNIERITDVITDFRRKRGTNSMTLKVPRITPDLRQRLAVLYRAAPLHDLEITFPDKDTTQTLTVIRETVFDLIEFAHSLHTLRLDLSGLRPFDLHSNGEDYTLYQGCRALSRLTMVRSLHTLWIDLSDSDVGDDAIGSLVVLKTSPLLHTLRLDLKNANIGPSGAKALATLREAPALETLYLELGGNHIGDDGSLFFEDLKRSPVLRNLYLGCGNNQIGSIGAEAFSTLSDAPALETLHIELEDNLIDWTGTFHLGDLVWGLVLRTLYLGLRNNRLCLLSIRHLTSPLRFLHTRYEPGYLNSLHLDFRQNEIGTGLRTVRELNKNTIPGIHVEIEFDEPQWHTKLVSALSPIREMVSAVWPWANTWA
jgi:hypothetical protein